MEQSEINLLEKALMLKAKMNVPTVFFNFPRLCDVKNKSETEKMLSHLTFSNENKYFKVLYSVLNIPNEVSEGDINNFLDKKVPIDENNKGFFKLLKLLIDPKVKETMEKLYINSTYVEWLKSNPKHIKETYLELEDYSDSYINNIMSHTGHSKKMNVCIDGDYESKYVNKNNGIRATTDVPEEYEYTIHMFGDSRIAGYGSEDKYTISSILQRILNKSSLKNNYRVVNYGGHKTPDFKVNMCKLIDLAPINPNLGGGGGDIVIISTYFHEEFFECCNSLPVSAFDLRTLFERPHNLGEVFIDCGHHSSDLAHYNHRGNAKIADTIFNILFENKIINEDFKDEIQSLRQVHSEQNDNPLSDDGYKDNKDLLKYIEFLNSIKHDTDGTIGAIVMNCNPFTLGHRYLIEKASSEVDFLYIFVVEEDKSYFKFEDRIMLVKEGTRHIDNVKAVPSGKFIISLETFPEYFDKDAPKTATINASADVEIFAKYIAPALNISTRFVGEEPTDITTRQYNEFMEHILPKYNINFVKYDRCEFNTKPISASTVRALIKDRNFDEIKELVPKTTYNYLKSKFS